MNAVLNFIATKPGYVLAMLIAYNFAVIILSVVVWTRPIVIIETKKE